SIVTSKYGDKGFAIDTTAAQSFIYPTCALCSVAPPFSSSVLLLAPAAQQKSPKARLSRSTGLRTLLRAFFRGSPERVVCYSFTGGAGVCPVRPRESPAGFSLSCGPAGAHHALRP